MLSQFTVNIRGRLDSYRQIHVVQAKVTEPSVIQENLNLCRAQATQSTTWRKILWSVLLNRWWDLYSKCSLQQRPAMPSPLSPYLRPLYCTHILHCWADNMNMMKNLLRPEWLTARKEKSSYALPTSILNHFTHIDKSPQSFFFPGWTTLTVSRPLPICQMQVP